MTRSRRPTLECQQHQVIRALRASAEAMTIEQLGVATGLVSLALSAAVTALVVRGAIVKLIRTRPGRAGTAVYVVAGAVPDPLRAS